MMNDNFYSSELATSSKDDKWNTPKDLIDDLATVFDFDLDVCASKPNVCDNYFTKEQDGRIQDWDGLCWMNPPYGRGIDVWMKKASKNNVVCLVPARTDTKWWQDNIGKASFVVFIKGRLCFNDISKSARAPFPNAFVVFGSITGSQKEKLASYGWAINQ